MGTAFAEFDQHRPTGVFYCLVIIVAGMFVGNTALVIVSQVAVVAWLAR